MRVRGRPSRSARRATTRSTSSTTRTRTRAKRPRRGGGYPPGGPDQVAGTATIDWRNRRANAIAPAVRAEPGGPSACVRAPVRERDLLPALRLGGSLRWCGRIPTATCRSRAASSRFRTLNEIDMHQGGQMPVEEASSEEDPVRPIHHVGRLVCPQPRARARGAQRGEGRRDVPARAPGAAVSRRRRPGLRLWPGDRTRSTTRRPCRKDSLCSQASAR